HGMMGLVASGIGQIADARSNGRFTGSEAEPREGMRSGHMPGAVNLPFMELTQEGSLKDLDTLKQIITDSGLDLTKPVVTTCGSGVTAAVINLALSSLGRDDSRLYDGSWSEWGSRDDTMISKAK
ncbi:MAG: rhodanese-like domain-containing protein, partial [Pseudomonadota bacterium]